MSSLLGRDNALLLQVRNDLLDGLGDVDLVRLDVDLRRHGGLVRRADARELLDLAGARLLVQALRVALLDDGDRRVDEDLDEGKGRVVLRVQLARQLAVRNVRRDEGRQSERARGREQERDLADAADLASAKSPAGGGSPSACCHCPAAVIVLRSSKGAAAVDEQPSLSRRSRAPIGALGTHVLDARSRVEAQVLVQAEADIVAVEAERVELLVQEGLLEGGRDRALARGGEAGEPHGRALLAEQLRALLLRHRAGVEGDVGRLGGRHCCCGEGWG